MFVVLVDKVTLDGLERLIHAVEHQVVPVGGQAHELMETSRVKLDQCEGDNAIQEVFITAKLDRLFVRWQNESANLDGHSCINSFRTSTRTKNVTRVLLLVYAVLPVNIALQIQLFR